MNIPKEWPTEEMLKAAEMVDVHPYRDTKSYQQLVFEAMIAAAPPAPAQNYDKVMADYNEPAMESSWQSLKTQLDPREWTTGEAFNYRGFFAWGWEARRQYGAPAQEDEPVGYIDKHGAFWTLGCTREELGDSNFLGLRPLYTRPDNSGLRQAAEEVIASIRTEVDNVTFANALENLRAALEGK